MVQTLSPAGNHAIKIIKSRGDLAGTMHIAMNFETHI